MSILSKLVQKNSSPEEATPVSKPMLGLSISAGVVKATIWELRDHTIEIIGLGVKNYSDSGKENHPDFKTISERAADAIDLACQVAEVDVKETVFGVPQSWIEEEQLLPEYDDITSKLAKNLDLEAVAYVSIPHAISYYLQYLHKTPTTAILIGSSREGANIAYVENGKIKENSYVEWSGGNLGKNVDNGILKFEQMTELPPAFFLYGFGDLITARNELLKYDWSSSDRMGDTKKVPVCVSAPKITVLEEHADSLAVSLVGAKDYARHHEIQGRLSIKSLEYGTLNSQMPAVVEEPSPTALTETSATVASVAAISAVTSATAASASDIPFGFVANQDISEHGSKEAKEISGAVEDEELDVLTNEEEQIESTHSDVQEPWHTNNPNQKSSFMSNFKIPKINISNKNMRQVAYIAVIVIVLLFVGGGSAAWAYWNIPKATVTVFVKPANIEKQITITASEKNTTVAESKIPAQKITVELKDVREASTTGKRTTGQVATGQVSMINKTGSSKTFSAGTELQANGNIRFTLTEGVTVASASAETTSEGEVKTYGKANVKVSAKEIGPEGNIDKDASLSVVSFTKDDYEAKVVDKLTGGSKKDIKVVAALDRTNLSRDLKSDMQLRLPQLVREKVGADDILLDSAWQITSTTEKFSKAVNDETNTLGLDLTIKAEGYTFKKADVEKVLDGIATAAIPDGYEPGDDTKDIRTDFVSLAKDGTLSLNAVNKISIIPTINEKEIAAKILGKKEEAAKASIIDNNKIYDMSFEYSMRVPEPLMTLPHKEENITVKRGIR